MHGLEKCDLMLMRAKMTQGVKPRFLEGPLGVNMLRLIPKRIQDKLLYNHLKSLNRYESVVIESSTSKCNRSECYSKQSHV